MFDTITNALIHKCADGKKNFDQSAVNLCACYAENSLNIICKSFGDIYYAAFAMSSCKALNVNFDMQVLGAYLGKMDFKNFDLPHLASLARCFYLVELKNEKLLERIKETKADTAYEIFLKAGALSDCGERSRELCDTSKIEKLRLNCGGFSNLKNSDFAGVNATAAAICAQYFFNDKIDCAALDFLISTQDISGGFKAQTDSPCPDLLSSACALFAINLCGHKPRYGAREFIAAHWIGDGSFSSTAFDEKGDCEYAFYGVLASGSCDE